MTNKRERVQRIALQIMKKKIKEHEISIHHIDIQEVQDNFKVVINYKNLHNMNRKTKTRRINKNVTTKVVE